MAAGNVAATSDNGKSLYQIGWVKLGLATRNSRKSLADPGSAAKQ